MKKIIAFVFSIPSPQEAPFTDTLSRDSYQLLQTLGQRRDIDIRFVLGEKYTDGAFPSFWKFEGNTLTKHTTSFIPNLIYLQTREQNQLYEKRINSSFLEELCLDKYKTAQVFSVYSKKIKLVTKDSNVSDFETDLIVLKPQFGAQGDKVSIIKKEAYNPQPFLNDKFIVQEFIDSSEGVASLMRKRHELRLYVLNGLVEAAYLRVPADNSYIANIAQGATEKMIDLSDIPSSAYEMAAHIDKTFSAISPRLYTIDVMFEKDRPWLVELNDMPGMPNVAVQPFTNDYFQKLLTLFENN